MMAPKVSAIFNLVSSWICWYMICPIYGSFFEDLHCEIWWYSLNFSVMDSDETTPFFDFLWADVVLVFSLNFSFIDLVVSLPRFWYFDLLLFFGIGMDAAYGTTKYQIGVASTGVLNPEHVMESIFMWFWLVCWFCPIKYTDEGI